MLAYGQQCRLALRNEIQGLSRKTVEMRSRGTLEHYRHNPRHPERLVAHSWPANTFRYITPTDFSASIPSVANEHLLFAGVDLKHGDRQPNIFSINLADEKKILRLTDTPYEEWRPVQSINGDIFFIAKNGNHFDIFRQNALGKIKLPQSSQSDDWDPAISSDGRYIAFASKETGDWELHLANLMNSKPAAQLNIKDSDEWDPTFGYKDRMVLFASAGTDGPQIMGTCLY